MWAWLIAINFSLLPSPKEAALLACINDIGWTPHKGDLVVLEKYGYHYKEPKSNPNAEFNWAAWNEQYEKKIVEGRETWVEKIKDKVLANK